MQGGAICVMLSARRPDDQGTDIPPCGYVADGEWKPGCPEPRGVAMTRRTSSLFARPTDESGRRVQATVFLPRLTTAEGEWLAKVLPALQRRARPEPQAVRVEDVAL